MASRNVLSSLSRNAVLAALVLIVVAGVVGVIVNHENATQIIGFCSMVCVSLLTLLQQNKNMEKMEVVAAKADIVAAKTEIAAVRVEDVRKALLVTDAKTDAKLTAIHGLVNSSMSEVLKLNAITSRRLANMTHSLEDGKAADLAERLSAEHDSKQRLVDKQDAERIFDAKLIADLRAFYADIEGRPSTEILRSAIERAFGQQLFRDVARVQKITPEAALDAAVALVDNNSPWEEKK